MADEISKSLKNPRGDGLYRNLAPAANAAKAYNTLSLTLCRRIFLAPGSKKIESRERETATAETPDGPV